MYASQARRRVLLVAAIIVMAFGILGVPEEDESPPSDHFLLLDLSRSHGLDSRALLEEALARFQVRGIGNGDRLTLLAFGAGTLELAPSVSPVLTEGFRERSRLDLALDWVRDRAKPDRPPHVIIFGDGRYSHELLEATSTFVSQRGGTLHLEGPLLPPDEDLRLESTGPLPELTPNRAARVTLHVRGTTRMGRRVTVRVGATSTRIRVLPGGTATVSILVTPDPGAHFVEAVIADPGGPDAHTANNRIRLPVRASGRRTVGVLGQRGEDALAGLDPSRFRIIRIPGASGITGSVLAAMDVLVLVDVPMGTDGLVERQISTVIRAVSEGGLGLVVTGGAHSFAAGGYGPSSLDALLPLSSRPGAERRIIVLLDRSGSMEAERRLVRAGEAVIRLCGGLTGDDRVQVVPFAGAPDAALPAKAVAPRQFMAGPAARLRELAAGGPTRVAPALRKALELLRDVLRGQRVILLLSDFKDTALDAEVAKLRADLVSAKTEVVAVLLDPEPLTVARAEALGARVVLAPRVTPDILLEAVSQGGWVETATAVVWPRGEVPTGAGPLRGWNRVRTGKEALIWARGDSGAPLGAEARRGAGFVTAFASDVLLEGWTRLLVARLVDSALPTAEETPCWWQGDRLRFQAPTSHRGEDLVLGSVERPVPVREVEVGVFEAECPQTDEAPVALPVRSAQGALLARLLPPPRLDPEWGRPPLDVDSWQRGVAAPVAGGRRRWPILAAALLLLSCLAATRRQENHLP